MGVAIGTALLVGTLATLGLCVFAQPSRNLPACVSTDCNCSDFRNGQEAQDVLNIDRGDPFDLDRDSNGIACENLAGAPRYNSTPSASNRPPSGTTNVPRSNSPNSSHPNSPNPNPSNNAAPIRDLW